MEKTALLSLPYIMPSQAQKHVTHNEVLRMLDAIVHLRVEDRDRNSPPPSPVEGQRHLLGVAPTGAFAGHAGAIAAFQDGAWSFYQPREGWAIWDASGGGLLALDDGAWKPVFNTQNVPMLGVNTTADATNRLAVRAAASLLTHEGAGHQLKLNKASATDTGSLLFQTGWSGRAEMGLAASDDFTVKVSADGGVWRTALAIDRATARLGFGVIAPQAVMHVKAEANGQNLFRFDDAAGTSLWRGVYDGSNFHFTWGSRVYNNFTGSGCITVSGGDGLHVDLCRIVPTAAQGAAGTHGLRIGHGGSESYATAAQQLTRPNMSFRSWAWNGSNGYSLSSTGWFGMDQTAAVNGEARFFWRLNSFGSADRMTLDHAGNLQVSGAVTTAGFAKVGSFTVASLPSAASTGAGATIFVSNEAGGATLAFSDGTNWRRVADRAVVS